jgi:hypothetical protein
MPSSRACGGRGGETWRVDRLIFVSEATFDWAIDGVPGATSIGMSSRAAGHSEHARDASWRLLRCVQAPNLGMKNFPRDWRAGGLGSRALRLRATTGPVPARRLGALAREGLVASIPRSAARGLPARRESYRGRNPNRTTRDEAVFGLHLLGGMPSNQKLVQAQEYIPW